jgi:hypothetical protein
MDKKNSLAQICAARYRHNSGNNSLCCNAD